MTVPGQFGGGGPTPPLYVQAQRPPERTGKRRPPSRASQRRGCLLWVLALLVAGGGVALLVKKTMIDPPPAAAAHLGSDRTTVEGGGYQVSLYDKAVPQTGGSISAGGTRIAQLARWRVSQKGWTEEVTIYRDPGALYLDPGEVGDAADFAFENDWDIAGRQFNRNRGTSGDATEIAGLPLARLYTSATNTRWGRYDPDGDQQTFYDTRLAITTTADGKAIVVIQVTWDDDHRPPKDEIDIIRRSIEAA